MLRQIIIVGIVVAVIISTSAARANAAEFVPEPTRIFASEKYEALDMTSMDVVNQPEIGASEKTGDAAPEKFSATAKSDGEDDEYNFSWLDPEKKVYVLQNRKYRKAGHAGIFLGGAMNLSSPFKTHYAGMVRPSYWFTENLGIELFYATGTNRDTSTIVSLRRVSSSALPFVREVRSYYGAVASWVPWYAKLNFFNKILYLDWAVNAGAGQINTAYDRNNKASGTPDYIDEQDMAYFVGTSQNYFISRNWSVRLDLISYFYRAKGADGSTVNTYKNYDFGVGVGYLF